MKRSLFLLVLIYFCLSIYPQQVIENTKKPLNKNMGRTLKLEEKFTIKDESDAFYFKNPSNIKVAPDGTIFVADTNEFLKFSKEGKFLKNLFNKGIGPGEFLKIENFIFYQNKIIAFQIQPNKIVEMDMDGKLIKEIRPRTMIFRFLTCYRDKYIVLRNSFSHIPQEEMGVIDVKWEIATVSEDGKVEDTGLCFPVKWFGKKIGGAIVSNYITDFFYTVFKEKYLLVFNTEEYMLKLVDVDKKKIARSFKRDYESVKFIPDKNTNIKIPKDYFNDILKILVRNDGIWVFTSTIDKDKRILIDVFNIDGKYLDCFYLPLPKNMELNDVRNFPIAIAGDFIFSIREDENGAFFLSKYKITN
jgi:hypothetical protein